jgi:galactoside 2-L-fucosyltransferase 1/2
VCPICRAHDHPQASRDCGGRACGDPETEFGILMGCDHMIITTGTFGWWAGYLGKSGRKGEVVYYEREFQMDHATNKGKVALVDYYPPSWKPMSGEES